MTKDSKGKKVINNNTAFYRRIKNEYDLKKWKNYSKYFCLPPYLYRDDIKISQTTTTLQKDCVQHLKKTKGKPSP